jgi:hypothetical protein
MQSKEVTQKVSQSTSGKVCPLNWKTAALFGGVAALGYGIYRLNQANK